MRLASGSELVNKVKKNLSVYIRKYCNCGGGGWFRDFHRFTHFETPLNMKKRFLECHMFACMGTFLPPE
jgi:hypothetical protein